MINYFFKWDRVIKYICKKITICFKCVCFVKNWHFYENINKKVNKKHKFKTLILIIKNISEFNANIKNILLVIHPIYFLFILVEILYSPSRCDIFFSSCCSLNPPIRVTTLIWLNAICSDNGRGQLPLPPANSISSEIVWCQLLRTFEE